MNLRCDNTFVQDEGWYEAMAPDEIKSQSICIDGDIGDVILSII